MTGYFMILLRPRKELSVAVILVMGLFKSKFKVNVVCQGSKVQNTQN